MPLYSPQLTEYWPSAAYLMEDCLEAVSKNYLSLRVALLAGMATCG
jgi:hypothetical protein